jgi:hypothetical protein
MLKTLKRCLLTATKQTRLLEYVADSERRRQRLLILCDHSISLDQEHLWHRPAFFTAEGWLSGFSQVRLRRGGMGQE